MKLEAPRTIRAVANAFLAYRDDLGIDSVIDVFDWADVSPQQVYYAVLGRLPEGREVAVPAPGFYARELFHIALHSEEFQQQIVRLTLEAFRDKRRLIFIHIPKCAGVDLTLRLAERYAHLHEGLTERTWTDRSGLFQFLHAFAKAANNSDAVFFGGHVTLPGVLERGLLRFGDEVFTIVRDPTLRALSSVNYVIEILRNRHDPMRPDRLDWLERLGYPRTAEWIARESLPDVARRILRDPALLVPNTLCSLLGDGDAESALDALACSNIEITEVVRYDAWARARWGFQASPRLNPSTPILRPDDLTAQDREALQSLTSEDQTLYRLIRDEMDAKGALSVRGVAVARRA
jgi:hypothetical protein